MKIKAQRGITYKNIIILDCVFFLVSSDGEVQKTNKEVPRQRSTTLQNYITVLDKYNLIL